jgi:dipeptidyl-peptidase-2
MWFLWEVAFLVAFSALEGSNGHTVAYKELYYEQVIDHFNVYWKSYGRETFPQRYLVQDKWWDHDNQGPIFFYTGNEGDIVGFWNNSGFLFEVAADFGALIVFAEHRYYGKSLPFKEDSFKHPCIGFLSAEQALADFASLISDLKVQLNASQSPVIAFGGSYGGMLSAYMRLHYPNIVSGSIASSAPILVIAGDSSRETFFQDVTKDFERAEVGCVDRVKAAFRTMSALADSGTAGLKNLSATFNLCSDLQSVGDYHHLVGWLRNAFTVLAMMDYPYPTDFLAPLPANPVQVACRKLLSAGDVLIGISQVAGMCYGSSQCHDIQMEYVECSDPTGCGTGPNSLAWDYQSCTEFVMPAGTNNVTDMFPVLPFTLQQREDYCLRRWDIKPRNNWTRIHFWGKDIKSASNIVFSNGLLDPWCRGGMLHNVSESLTAILIEGGAHHLDLRGSNPADPPSVIAARQLEKYYISQWIKQSRLL